VDLTGFLTARLNEDEAAANDVYGFWRPDGARRIVDDSYAAVLIKDVDERTRAFILRHDPARVLREVEAKRAILARYVAPWPHNLGESLQLSQERMGLLYAVEHLAAVYSDHPDYDPAWKE